jgi:hypothetical protein
MTTKIGHIIPGKKVIVTNDKCGGNPPILLFRQPPYSLPRDILEIVAVTGKSSKTVEVLVGGNVYYTYWYQLRLLTKKIP